MARSTSARGGRISAVGGRWASARRLADLREVEFRRRVRHMRRKPSSASRHGPLPAAPEAVQRTAEDSRFPCASAEPGPMIGMAGAPRPAAAWKAAFAPVPAPDAVLILRARSLRRRKRCDNRRTGAEGESPMPTTFRPYDPDQMLLLAPDVRDWLTEGHFAHHVSDLVDGLDLTAFYAPYEGDGRRNAPYEPRMMVKVLVYGYATGVFSSRGMARKLEEDVAFRVLGAGNFPSHRTLCEFRRRHLEEFKGLFVEVVCLAREVGLLSFGKLSIDGTKVRANASKRKAMSYGRMGEEERRLEGEIEALLNRARETDAEEDARFGESLRGDELPEELRRREDRLAAIVAAKARLEAAQREADDARGRRPEWERHPKGGKPYKRAYGEPDEKAQSNFTRPRQCHHEDQRRGLPAMLQRAGGGRWRASVDCRDGTDDKCKRPGRDGGAAR